MTATAVSLTMVSLKSEKLQHSAASTGIMTSAILDDIAALAAVAVIVPMAAGDTDITVVDISLILFKAALLIALLISLLSFQFGFHPAVGAYMAGLIIKQEYFHFHEHPEIDYYNETKKIVDNVAFSWIGPVFFVDLGTKIIFEQSILISVIPQIVILTVGLLIAQILSAGLAARYTGNYEW